MPYDRHNKHADAMLLDAIVRLARLNNGYVQIGLITPILIQQGALSNDPNRTHHATHNTIGVTIKRSGLFELVVDKNEKRQGRGIYRLKEHTQFK